MANIMGRKLPGDKFPNGVTFREAVVLFPRGEIFIGVQNFEEHFFHWVHIRNNILSRDSFAESSFPENNAPRTKKYA